ncbi:guanylate kinase [Gemmatimonadota bacterium]
MTKLGSKVPPLVLAAPSGAGKTTIARALVEREEDFEFSISVTTRAPRPRETDGADYFFVTEEEFLALVEEGELVEWARVHGFYYGTPLHNLVEVGGKGRHVVLDIDVQGARQIREAVPEALLLFILPPSLEVLLGRLTGRGTEEDEVIRRRLRTALEELKAAEEFDFFVMNDNLERAIREVRELARTGAPQRGGSSGSVEQARALRKGLESYLRRTGDTGTLIET